LIMSPSLGTARGSHALVAWGSSVVQDRLGFDLFDDTQAIKNLLEIDAARSADCRVGIRDRSGGQECAFKGFRGDVRLRRSRANRNAATDAGDGHLAARRDLALFREVLDDA